MFIQHLGANRKRLALTGVAAALLALFATAGQPAQAYTHYLVDVHTNYPIMIGSRIDNCGLCHQADAANYPALNLFGQAFMAANFNLAAIDGQDSDGDGSLNGEEINAQTSPADPNDRPIARSDFGSFVYLPVITKGPSPVSNGQYVIIGWNDLGMHCMDPSFEDFSVLPPYNTLWAQVIRRGREPRVVTNGVTVEYRIVNNSYSVVKTNFWDFC